MIFSPERGQLRFVAAEPTDGKDRASLAEASDKVARAHASLKAMRSLSQTDVDRIVAAMAGAVAPEAARLAALAPRETGYGNGAGKTTTPLTSAT